MSLHPLALKVFEGPAPGALLGAGATSVHSADEHTACLPVRGERKIYITGREESVRGDRVPR